MFFNKSKLFLFAIMLSIILGFGGGLVHGEFTPGVKANSGKKGEKRYHVDQLIVEVANVVEAERIASKKGLKIKRHFKRLSKYRNTWVGVMAKNSRVKELGVSVESLLAEVRAESGVIQANYDYKIYLTATPNDPRFGELWGLHNNDDMDIDAPEAWDLGTGSSDVVVAVIDTGVDYTHQDLAANMWKNPLEIPDNGVDDDNNGYIDDEYGIDVAYGDTDPMGDHYHGTHCAGTIGAKGNNGVGVVGVNWDVKIMALKLFDSSGSAYTSRAVACYEYLIDQKQKGHNIVAVSNSWGGGDPIQELFDIIVLAGENGILSVCAAGNASEDNDVIPHYPSGYDTEYVIAVAATNSDDDLASFSHWGATTVDLGAPGTGILSCEPGDSYRIASGTSMATPHVSGAVAMVASHYPNDTALQRKSRIMNSVDPLTSLSGKCVSGGRLNLFNAVQTGGLIAPDFSFTKNGDLTRVFTDTSNASGCTISGWSWNFGDGGTSAEQNPTHTYAVEGWYDVTLTVTGDNDASAGVTKSVWAGPNKAPTADFSYKSGTNMSIQFTDLSSDPDGELASWNWSFSDGEVSIQQNPTHTYSLPGTYSVTLTVVDQDGSSASVTKPVIVTLDYCESSTYSGGLLSVDNVTIGDFSNPSGKDKYSDFTHLIVNMEAGASHNTVVSLNSSYYSGYARIYIDLNLDGDFEDSGEIVFEQNGNGDISGTIAIPTSGIVIGHVTRMRISVEENGYLGPCSTGVGWGEVEDYSVLINSGGGGGNEAPTAEYYYSADNLTVTYTDASSDADGSIASWSWDLGDGNVSTQQNPVHSYAADGTYTVVLTVTDNEGLTDTVSRQVTVTDGGSGGGEFPTYCPSESSSSLFGYCAGVEVANLENPSGESKYSDFTGMTVNMSRNQSYTITLTATNGSGWNANWRVYIDYNRDGDFDDAGEIAFEGSGSGVGSLSGSLTVPSSAVAGQALGMRVSVKFSTSSSSYRGPCEIANWGEVEDYALVIQ
jgi:PKD repeat protein